MSSSLHMMVNTGACSWSRLPVLMGFLLLWFQSSPSLAQASGCAGLFQGSGDFILKMAVAEAVNNGNTGNLLAWARPKLGTLEGLQEIADQHQLLETALPVFLHPLFITPEDAVDSLGRRGARDLPVVAFAVQIGFSLETTPAGKPTARAMAARTFIWDFLEEADEVELAGRRKFIELAPRLKLAMKAAREAQATWKEQTHYLEYQGNPFDNRPPSTNTIREIENLINNGPDGLRRLYTRNPYFVLPPQMVNIFKLRVSDAYNILLQSEGTMRVMWVVAIIRMIRIAKDPDIENDIRNYATNWLDLLSSDNKIWHNPLISSLLQELYTER